MPFLSHSFYFLSHCQLHFITACMLEMLMLLKVYMARIFRCTALVILSLIDTPFFTLFLSYQNNGVVQLLCVAELHTATPWCLCTHQRMLDPRRGGSERTHRAQYTDTRSLSEQDALFYRFKEKQHLKILQFILMPFQSFIFYAISKNCFYIFVKN